MSFAARVTGPFVRVIPRTGSAYTWFVERLFSIEDEPSLSFTVQRVINGHELHGSLVLLRGMRTAGGELLRRLCLDDLTDQFRGPCVVYLGASDVVADAVSADAWESHLVVVNRGIRKGSKPFLVEDLLRVDIGDGVLKVPRQRRCSRSAVGNRADEAQTRQVSSLTPRTRSSRTHASAAPACPLCRSRCGSRTFCARPGARFGALSLEVRTARTLRLAVAHSTAGEWRT